MVLLSITVIVIMVVFAPFISERNRNKYESSYRLEEGFGKPDVKTVIQRMQKDNEFWFYFHVLPSAWVEKAGDEVYAILNKNRSQAALAGQIKELQVQVRSLAIRFNAFQYPTAFLRSPQDYPVLATALVDFLYMEFKLTILGACYKSTYDIKFYFNWDVYVRQAAVELQKIIVQMGGSPRRVLFENYPPR